MNFSEVWDAAHQKLVDAATTIGIPAASIVQGGLDVAAPAINSELLPVTNENSENGDFKNALAELNLYVHAEPQASDVEAMKAAMELAGKVATSMIRTKYIIKSKGVALAAMESNAAIVVITYVVTYNPLG
jgi:hypothetical protein